MQLKLIIAGLLAALAAAAPAGASGGRAPISIDMKGVITSYEPGVSATVEGTWAATRLITDSGTYKEWVRFDGSKLYAVKVLVSPLGVIVLGVQTVVETSATGVMTFKGGSWRVVYGLGAYSDLEAGGRPATTPDSAVVGADIHVTHVGRGEND
jgi:hypothetical protein